MCRCKVTGWRVGALCILPLNFFCLNFSADKGGNEFLPMLYFQQRMVASLWVICVLDNTYTKREICSDSLHLFSFFSSFLFSPTKSHQRSKRLQMLFFTYLLSPSLDIVVKVARVAFIWLRAASGPVAFITHEEMDWSFMGCGAALHLLLGLIRKWDTQLSHGISGKLIWFCSTPPLFFHHVWSRTQSPVTARHTTSVCGKSFTVENLAVEILCFWSICCMRHTKRSYFWFHSEQRKCQLSHSSLKSWWRIIMNWTTARAMPFHALCEVDSISSAIANSLRFQSSFALHGSHLESLVKCGH